MNRPNRIRPANGKLAVLLPGLGAVATTTIAGVLLTRGGFAKPIGSLTQMSTIRLGPRTSARTPKIADFVSLAALGDLEFGGWDVFPDHAHARAVEADVLRKDDLDRVRNELERIQPMTAAFYPEYVRRLTGPHVKRARSKAEMVEQIRDDMRRFVLERKCERAVCIWCGSTETFTTPTSAHETIAAFERALGESDPGITNSQLYAWAALKEGIPFANGAPNLAVDFPAAWHLARDREVPIAGKDFKTGQTLMKTVVAPGLKARMLGVRGWFSTNILGNRDGEVLDDPGSFKTKEASKLSVLDVILERTSYPELYSELFHKVRIEYYPPRGDAKEGWDNIDLFGWLGYPMQMKIDFLCRDSILAAPVVLDLALFLDFAKRSSLRGIQEWLSFYFKSPMAAAGLRPEHDLFIQLMKMKNTLRWLMGEELITHLGHEYYD